MQLTILDEQHVRLATLGDGFEVVGEHFGPLQMLATSLALCTASVVQAYGDTAQLNVAGFEIDVQWGYVEDPYRVGNFDMTLLLPPTVPPQRHKAVIRAANTCTVHHTLQHHPHIATDVAVLDPAAPQAEAHHHHVHEA